MKTIHNIRDLLTYLAIFAAILIVANLVSRRLFFRWDWTENGIYTLSKSSRNIINQLDDRMLAKVYFSDNLPGDYANNRRYLQDLLEEFQAYSNGNFHFEFYRPEDDSELETEAQKYGVPPIQLQVIENDRMEIKSVWMGLTLLYEDRRETLPVIQSTAGLEYDLASALKKLINVNKRIAGIVIDEAYQGRNQRLNDLLGQTYDMTRVDLATPVPPNLNLLIMNGVTDSIGITKLYNLDQYLMSGRPLFIAQSSVEANLQQSSARLFSSDLLDALKHYGLEVSPGLVADRVASQVAVETQRGIFRMRNAVEYPFFPLIRTFNKDHLITSGLEQVRIFFTSPLSAVPDSLGQGAQFTPLMHTSDFTNYVQGPFFNISHVNNPNFVILNGPGLPVAGLLSGSASSTFTEENRPEQADLFISSTPRLQILVVGDREFFIDEAGGGIPENQNFVINAADYLVGDEDLIAVRSRQVSTRPLKVLSNGVRRTYRWINILGPSAMVAGLGLWRWRGSRTRRKFLEEVYGS